MNNSKNKIDSSNSKSKKNIINNSKKQTIINSIKKTRSNFIFLFKIIFAIVVIALRDIQFSKFLIVILLTLTARPFKNIFMKTPIKVDSQKNIIKLPITTFKLFLKKLFKIIEPVFSIINYSLRIIFIIFLVKIVLDVYKIYYPESSSKNNIEIFEYLKGLFKSNVTVYSAFNKIPFRDLIYNNIPSFNYKDILKIIALLIDKGVIIGEELIIKVVLPSYNLIVNLMWNIITHTGVLSWNILISINSIFNSVNEYFTKDTTSYFTWRDVNPNIPAIQETANNILEDILKNNYKL